MESPKKTKDLLLFMIQNYEAQKQEILTKYQEDNDASSVEEFFTGLIEMAQQHKGQWGDEQYQNRFALFNGDSQSATPLQRLQSDYKEFQRSLASSVSLKPTTPR